MASADTVPPGDAAPRPSKGPAAPADQAAVLEKMPLACFVLDEQWRFTYLSPRAEQLLSQLSGRPASDFLGKDVWKECPEVADSTFSRECQQALAEQRPLETETFYPALNRWFAVRVIPVPGRLCVFLQDVTERATLERVLRQRAEELTEADRGRNEFMVQLAHEVRNALVPVRNALHLARARVEEDPEDGRALDLAADEIRRLSRLMDDLLQVSQLLPENVRPKMERVNLADVVGRAVAATLASAGGRALSVRLPEGPLWLEADPTQLEQVVAHLLANAAKFTRPGGHVRVSAQREAAAVVLRVADDGVGMGAEVLPRAFHLFMRADRALGRMGGGLGIGLTLVKRLVELHGGTVEAHSAGPGEGSEFVVRLPAPDEAPPEEPWPEGEAEGERPLDVLVVDDSKEAAQSLAFVLGRWGYEARVAYDGAEALEQAEARRPDVVLLDIGMPGMDGYEVARRLREREGGDKVVLVAVTGYGQEEDRRRAREAGFDYHMVKPVDPGDLRELLAVTEGAGRRAS
jgi:signal transduction histidine kinase/ActR/RegA family two-component response regulator